MQLTFIIDALSTLKPEKDTSLALMRAAVARGHAVYIAQKQQISFISGQVVVDRAAWQSDILVQDSQRHVLTESDVVVIRTDPPVDSEYIYTTQLLEYAMAQGVRVLNHPASLRAWNEKIAITRFRQYAPPFIVSVNPSDVRAFLNEQRDIVVKPLDGMGGSRVFRLQVGDVNTSVILETLIQQGNRVMAQKYLAKITQGDKRILLINGKAVPYALARIPAHGELRGNLAAGGIGVAQTLSARDIEIAQVVGEVAKQHGLFLVGLDVIGDYLTEINVTSPTCMVEITQQTAYDVPKQFMEELEYEMA